jgi:hypothetical protein
MASIVTKFREIPLGYTSDPPAFNPFERMKRKASNGDASITAEFHGGRPRVNGVYEIDRASNQEGANLPTVFFTARTANTLGESLDLRAKISKPLSEGKEYVYSTISPNKTKQTVICFDLGGSEVETSGPHTLLNVATKKKYLVCFMDSTRKNGEDGEDVELEIEPLVNGEWHCGDSKRGGLFNINSTFFSPIRIKCKRNPLRRGNALNGYMDRLMDPYDGKDESDGVLKEELRRTIGLIETRREVLFQRKQTVGVAGAVAAEIDKEILRCDAAKNDLQAMIGNGPQYRALGARTAEKAVWSSGKEVTKADVATALQPLRGMAL